MICLNRADEDTHKRLSWNQSPEPLSPQNTTRQDLNGISNLREHVAAGQDADEDAGGGGLNGSGGGSGEKWHLGGPSPGVDDALPGAGRWSLIGLSSHLKQAVASGGEGQGCGRDSVISRDGLARLWGWITWLVSVLLVSYLLTAWNARSVNVLVPGEMISESNSGATLDGSGLSPSILDMPLHEATSSPSSSSISSQGHDLLLTAIHEPRQLAKRASTCESGGVDGDVYNTPLHVGALLIIWFVSSLACAFPLLAKRFRGLRIPQRFFFTVRHFGTGVLIATAFVHLLPTAFISLGDPCLGSFWTSDYPAMPGAIALAAIFLVTVVEMIFHPCRQVRPIPPKSTPVMAPAEDNDTAAEDEEAVGDDGPPLGGDVSVASSDEPTRPVRSMAPGRGRSLSMSYGLNRLNTAEQQEQNDSLQLDRNVESEKGAQGHAAEITDGGLTPEQKKRKERLQCVLLELGILFHSVFIGMALSVSVGNEFIILLIAIIFHQTFEGLALGARISAIKWDKSARQPWLMAIAYGCTTPIGQALGIATHTLYSPGSEIGLIVVGVMNSISAGLLTYASLVELMSEDFLSDESWKILRGTKRIVACILVFFGAFFMSLVGAWA